MPRRASSFFGFPPIIIPFASHDVCTLDWQSRLSTPSSRRLLSLIRQHEMRVSTHPGQFVLLNSPREEVVISAIRDLDYHADLLDLVGVDATGKIQIHLGGTYGDKPAAIDRFAETFSHSLSERVTKSARRRERRTPVFSRRLPDPARENRNTHFVRRVSSFPAQQWRNLCRSDDAGFTRTWNAEWDGVPIVDYSSQSGLRKNGAHTDHIEADDFRRFLTETRAFDFDIMLEIKDKETSAAEAVEIAQRIRPDVETESVSQTQSENRIEKVGVDSGRTLV